MKYKSFKQIMLENQTKRYEWPNDGSWDRNADQYLYSVYLQESNYGVLEKDDRIEDITYKLREDIIESLEDGFLKGEISVSVTQKFKYNDIKDIDIEWKLFHTGVTAISGIPTFIDGSYGSKTTTPNIYEIGFYFNRYNDDDESFIKDLLNFFQEDRSLIYIKHEVKHVLDLVDDLYPNTKYLSPKDINVTGSDYLSQKKEVDNFVVSVIEELKNIKKEYPDITYHKALRISPMYLRVENHIYPKMLNHFKSKLAYFWIQHYDDNIIAK